MIKAKKVLVILPTDTLAGAELTLKRIAKYLSVNGYDITIIFISKGDNGTWSDIHAKKIYLKAEREIYGLPLLLKEFVKFRMTGQSFDYAFSSHVHCNAVVSLARSIKLINVKQQIMRESTNIFSWFTGKTLKVFRFYYSFYRQDAAIICQTSRMRSELLDNVPKLMNNNVFVLGNAIDYLGVRRRARVAIDLPVPSREIVMVGRLVKEKGCEILLRTFSQMEDKSYSLRLIGAGPLRAELENLADKLGIQDRVIFMGFSSNPLPYMRAARLNVLSSVIEGFPNTLLEMMCVARRVVATECTDGIKDIPGVTTCAPNCDKALLSAIESSLALEKKQVEENIKSMRRHTAQLTVENYVNTIFNKVEAG
ncbi:glycosyltransferase [Pseudoalteromonas luteoviolacea]|uniref:glycosyltransferase n=1 Tax=Pseudoalteromonas luteoviolacea TaxID=43657 RepID=UPI001B3924C5|nr:glycosyltransferase [Pseudoalteromonas luteoviolacea]MBQ4812042.1 glycosyltransferase [Pseudoalteromonas luteoviolacea]